MAAEAEPLLRALRADEAELLERATLANLNWCGERFGPQDVRDRPEFAHYTRLEVARGDCGVVATGAGGAVLGVAWLVYLGPEAPGYGFVAAGVPELSVCVLDQAMRGQGIGTLLIGAVLDLARSRGDSAVSLSVEEANSAARLYERLGFVGAGLPGVLMRTLD